VRDDRTAVGAEFAEPVEEPGIARTFGLERLDAVLRGPRGDRRRDDLAAASGRCVGARDHTDELMAARRDRVERRQGDIGGSGEDNTHPTNPIDPRPPLTRDTFHSETREILYRAASFALR